MAKATKTTNRGEAVAIEGLAELLAGLRKLDDRSWLKAVAAISADAAGIVVTRAQGNARGAMQARAAKTIKAAKTQKGATIRFGSGVPFAFGAEFGAGRGSVRTRATGSYLGYNQFKPWRGSGSDAGYFLFPAVREAREEMTDEYVAKLDELAREAFPD